MNITGLIIGIKNKGDANRVAEILTAEHGIVYVFASGARRLHSKFMSITNILTIVSLECSANGELLLLKDGRCLGGFYNIVNDVNKFILAADVVKNVKIAVQNSEEASKLYSLLLTYMYSVDSMNAFDEDHEKVMSITVKLYIYMLCYLGYDVMQIAENIKIQKNNSSLINVCTEIKGMKISESMTSCKTLQNAVQAYRLLRWVYSEQLDMQLEDADILV